MKFRHPIQTHFNTTEKIIESENIVSSRLSDDVVQVLKTLFKTSIKIHWHNLTNTDTPKPHVLALKKDTTISKEGFGEIKIVFLFYKCSLTLIMPNHRSNILLANKMCKHLNKNGFSDYRYHADDANVVFTMEV